MVPLRQPAPGTRFTVPAGRNQPVWVDVYVPEDQAAGDYSGQVQLLSAGQTVGNLNLQLTVWSFTLSRETHLKSVVESGNRSDLYGWVFGISTDAETRQLHD